MKWKNYIFKLIILCYFLIKPINSYLREYSNKTRVVVLVKEIFRYTDQLKCSRTLPIGTNILLDYTTEGEKIVEEGINLENLIVFQHSENHSSIIETNCILGSYYIYCQIISEVPQDGNYAAYLANDTELEGNEANYLILEFMTTNKLHINSKHNPATTGWYGFLYDYYSFNYSSYFTIDYVYDLNESYPVIVDGKKLNCSIKGRFQTCYFTKDDFPGPPFGEIASYHGYGLNLCEDVEMIISILVTYFPNYVSVYKTTILSELIMPPGEDVSFKLNFEMTEAINETLKMKNDIIILTDGEIQINASCSDAQLGEYQFYCTTYNVSELGIFHISLPESVRQEPFIFTAFKGRNYVLITYNYSSPINDTFFFAYNYNQSGAIGHFALEFNNLLGDGYSPKILLDEKEISCMKEDYYMNCTFKEIDFPCITPYSTTYKGNVLNPLNFSEAEITLVVSGNCGSYGFMIKINFVLLFGVFFTLI